ncbi:agmatine deiminase family protein, partial [Winogradskyella sp.]|nr:agmatine deiminase family protein [Winogradskyella sp.]
MIRFISSLILLFGMVPTTVLAQSPIPHNTTPQELMLLQDVNFRQNRVTDPPTVPVRTMAEWEEVAYLVITWESNFSNILRQIVQAAVEECQVIITTQNQSAVATYLTANGVDLTNVSFMNENWDSIWIRDYAGNTVYSNDVGELALTDWIYNRPRPNDDAMPSAHASLLDLPIYITNSGTNDLVNTGGNFMTDGLGNAFASSLILNENEAGNPYGVSAKTESQIDEIMNAYMGIDQYIKMDILPYDVIHHIDMHMKLLDEETLLVSEYPPGVADGPQIEANIDYVLSNFQSPFGTPYKIERIPAPPSTSGSYPDTGGYYRTFTNAVFINKTVIIPTYRPEVDAPAIAQWEEMLPGYNIVGIDVDNSGENLISLLGAIHCITHTIGVDQPLWIVHQPVDQADSNATVSIDASIKHISGVQSAQAFYREIGAGAFVSMPMSPLGDDLWTADLVMPSGVTQVEYYI